MAKKQFSPAQLEAQKKFAELMKSKAGTGKNPKKPTAENALAAAGKKEDGISGEQILIAAVAVMALGFAVWYFFIREKEPQAQQPTQ